MLGLFLYFIYLVLFLLYGVLSIPVQPEYDVNNLDLLQNIFEVFTVQYNRSYSGSEKTQRFEYFRQNLALINKLNNINPDAVFGINNFADWSPEEKNPTMQSKLRYTNKDASRICNRVQVKPGMFSKAPESFDWKDHGAVTPVKNQGQCGSCWAHAVAELIHQRLYVAFHHSTASITMLIALWRPGHALSTIIDAASKPVITDLDSATEGQYAIKYNQQVVLSEQQLVDCIPNVDACYGATVYEAYETLKKEGGLMLRSDYPYKAIKESCRFNKSKIAAKVIGCRMYATNSTEGPLKDVLYSVGPLTVGLAGEGFEHYIGGIVTGTDCAFYEPTHAVILTGYGSDNGRDFWNVKNSFGESFGENGYIRIERGVGCLGIGEHATTSPVLDFE